MATKAKSTGFVLTGAIHKAIARDLASVSDSGAAMLSMREHLLKHVGSVKGLRGKPLPDADVARIADELKAEFTARPTISEKSVGPMTSTAAKVARCAPILAAMEPDKFAALNTWGKVAKFCTALQAAEFDLSKVSMEAAKADPVKLTVRSLKGILGGKSKHKCHSKGAKAVIALLAMRCGLNMGPIGEEYFDRAEAVKFLGL